MEDNVFYLNELSNEENDDIKLCSKSNIDELLKGSDSYGKKLFFLRCEKNKMIDLEKYIKECENKLIYSDKYLNEMIKKYDLNELNLIQEVASIVISSLTGSFFTYEYIESFKNNGFLVFPTYILAIISCLIIRYLIYNIKCAKIDYKNHKEYGKSIDEYKKVLKLRQ